jgi:hypothetical protein
MPRSTVLLQGRGAISGSAGAGKYGPSLAACGVLTAKETVLSDRDGRWVWIVHNLCFTAARLVGSVFLLS